MAGFIKDPDATLDYKIDWSNWLLNDVIDSSTWILESGLTEAASTNDTTTATVWISGGSPGVNYTVKNRIVTAGGRTDERSFTLRVRQR